MSYGWLTESAFIPKPAKKVQVGQSSVVWDDEIMDLKVTLEKEKKAREHHGGEALGKRDKKDLKPVVFGLRAFRQEKRWGRGQSSTRPGQKSRGREP